MKIYWFLAIAIMLVIGGIFYLEMKGNNTIVNIFGERQVPALNEMKKHQIIWNGVPLHDNTYVNNSDLCRASNLGMDIAIYPCKVSVLNPKNIIQYVNFTWSGNNPQQTSWIFAYSGRLDNGSMQYFNPNVSHVGNFWSEYSTWINNYLVNGVINYTNLGTPDNRCQLGSQNNTQMFEVWQRNITNPQHETIYCFTNVTVVNATAFRISGNVDTQGWLQHETNGTWLTVPVNYLGDNYLNTTYSFYTVQDAIFQPNQTIQTRWTYTPKNNEKTGKWHILGYGGTGIDDLLNALNSGNYLYVDPVWNTSYNVNLVGYWDFNSSRELVYGINNLSAFEGNPVYNDTDCLIGKCGQTTLNNNFRLNGSSSSQLNLTGNYTLVLWVRGIEFGGDYSVNPYFFGCVEALCNHQLGWDSPTLVYASAGWTGGAGNIFNTAVKTWFMVAVVGENAGGSPMNVSIYKDGVIAKSGATGDTENYNWSIGNIQNHIFDWHGEFDEMAYFNKSFTQAQVQELYNGGAGVTFSGQEASIDIAFNISLNYPDNYFNYTNIVWFNSTANVSDGNITNATLFLWKGTEFNMSNFTDMPENPTKAAPNLSLNMADGTYLWNVEYCGRNASNTGKCKFAGANKTITIDTVTPVVVINTPTSEINYHIWKQPINISWTITELSFDKAILEFNSTNYTLSGKINSTYLNMSDYNNRTITIWANDTAGNLGKSTLSWNYNIFEWNWSYNASAYETDNETYGINVTINSTKFSSIIGRLTFNGTTVVGDNISNGDEHIFWASQVLPQIYKNKNQTFLFNFTLVNATATFQLLSNETNQTVNIINMSLCDNALTPPYNYTFINYTYRNETAAQEWVSGTINAVFTYSITGGVNKSFTFQNFTESKSNSFCLLPQTKRYKIMQSLSYYNSESATRTYSSFNSLLVSNPLNKTLFLIPSGTGVSQTFQTISISQQVLSGVLINISQASYGDLESKLTDDSGVATFIMNPFVSYTVTASKSGYPTQVRQITPSSGQIVTIVMGESSTSNATGCGKGMLYDINPKYPVLLNETTYSFNFTLNSTFWSIDYFGFVLRNGSEIMGNKTSTNPSGGILNLVNNTGNETRIYMDYYYSIGGGNCTFNATTSWSVHNNWGSAWSLKTLFADMKTYMSSGFFGLTQWGLALISFIVILMVTGVLSYKFGLTSPASIMAAVTFLTGIFNYIGFLAPNNASGIFYYAPTIFTFICFLGVLFWEVTR